MEPCLINRLRPVEGESLRGFMHRLGKANHYEEENWFYDLLDLPHELNPNFVNESKQKERFVKFLKLSVDDISAMTIHKYAPAVIGQEIWGGTGSNIFLVGSTIVRFCPKCYLDTGADLLRWLLRPVTVCHKHGVLLIDTCPACGRKMFWKNSCLNCGIKVEDMNLTSIERETLDWELAELVWGAISGISTNEPVKERCLLSQFTTQQIFFLLRELSTLILEYDQNNPNLKPIREQHRTDSGSRPGLRMLPLREYHQVMVSVIDAISDWPNHWNALLMRVLEAEDARRNLPEATFKRKSFANALGKIAGCDPAFTWLWTGFTDFVRNESKDKAGMSYWSRYLYRDFPSESAAYFPVRSVPVGKVTPREGTPEIFSFNATMKFLDVSRASLLALIQRGLVIPEDKLTPATRTKWLFSKGHLDDVLANLIGGLESRDNDGEEIVFLGSAGKYASHAGLQWIDVLSAIQVIELIAYRQPTSHGLNSIWVYKEQLQDYVQRVKDQRSLSVYTVMKILQCGIETLVHLAHAGLLYPTTGYPDRDVKFWKYTLDGITMYKQRYVNSKEAAEIVGFTFYRIISWAQKGWIDPVSRPNIDGCHQYRFDREKIIQWRYDRIPSKELLDLLGISRQTMYAWVAKGKLVPMENMPKFPYWFYRKDVENLCKREHRFSDKANQS